MRESIQACFHGISMGIKALRDWRLREEIMGLVLSVLLEPTAKPMESIRTLLHGIFPRICLPFVFYNRARAQGTFLQFTCSCIFSLCGDMPHSSARSRSRSPCPVWKGRVEVRELLKVRWLLRQHVKSFNTMKGSLDSLIQRYTAKTQKWAAAGDSVEISQHAAHVAAWILFGACDV